MEWQDFYNNQQRFWQFFPETMKVHFLIYKIELTVAEDLTQDLCIKVVDNQDTLLEYETYHLKNWCYCIAKNMVISWFRKHKNKPTFVEPQIGMEEKKSTSSWEEILDNVIEKNPHIEKEKLYVYWQEYLQDCISNLNTKEKNFLFIKWNGFLFHIDIKYKALLEMAKIDDEIFQIFKDRGYLLCKDTIALQQKGSYWTLSDQKTQKEYKIEPSGNMLKVFCKRTKRKNIPSDYGNKQKQELLWQKIMKSLYKCFIGKL